MKNCGSKVGGMEWWEGGNAWCLEDGLDGLDGLGRRRGILGAWFGA